MHLASSGRVIVHLSEKIAEGQVLCDKSGTRVAKVVELIGSVKGPLASATPITNNIKRYMGTNVFTTERPPASAKRKTWRKKNERVRGTKLS